MSIVRGKSPVITSIRPNSRHEKIQQVVWLAGTGFTGASTVTVGGIAMASVSLLTDGRLQCLLPAAQNAGDAPLVVTEGNYDSVAFPFALDSITPAGGDQYPNVDQRLQPLLASFKGRDDQQRVPAGQQFTGTLPAVDQEAIGSGTGPTTGGIWHYNQKTYISHIEWYSVGEEGGDRSAGSGIFLGRRSGSATLLVDLANVLFSAEITEDIELNKGDYIKIVTSGATLEMVANVSNIASKRPLNR